MEKKEGTEKQIEALKKLRARVGMKRVDFSRELGIPLRTIEEWEHGTRRMPDYLLRFLCYYVLGKMVYDQEINDHILKHLEDDEECS